MNNIQIIREKQGLSRDDLAKLIDCTYKHLYNIEKDITPNPGIYMVARIAKALHCQIQDLYPDLPLYRNI